MKRPQVSQVVVDMFAYAIDKQVKKGFEKYNKTIDDASDDDWDWVEMALEEAIDLSQYLVKENIKLRKEIAELRRQLEQKPNISEEINPKYMDLDDE